MSGPGSALGRALAESLIAERARVRLRDYVRLAWPVVEPSTPYLHNWHIDAVCEHLEAVSAGHLRNLVINMPPRHMKSLTVAVFWPTWEWLTHPERRWLFASYALSLSIRDSLKCRRLILSPWYQRHFGHIYRLTDDQNAKLRFENDKTGYRLSTSVGGAATGEGGDRIVVDDPHNVTEAESEAIRAATLVWWDETMSTRLNDPKTGAKVIVMQRVHADDLTGHVLAQGGYEHLCLPAEYEPTTYVSGIGWRDPRLAEGELLWPARVGPAQLAELRMRLGSYGYAGQMQQRPAPRGGGMIKRHWWRRYGAFDRSAAEQVILVLDTAFKETTTADYSVCATWAKTPQGVYVLDVVRERLEFPDLKRVVRDLYARWAPSLVLVEDKASGQSLVQELGRPDERDPVRWPRLPVVAVKVDRDKVARAAAVTPYIEAGLVYLPEQAPWVEDWIAEHAAFPKAPYDDQVDTTTMALMRFYGGPELPYGWLLNDPSFRAAVLGTSAAASPSPTAEPLPAATAAPPAVAAAAVSEGGGLPFQWLTSDPAFQGQVLGVTPPKPRQTEEERIAARMASYYAQAGVSAPVPVADEPRPEPAYKTADERRQDEWNRRVAGDVRP